MSEESIGTTRHGADEGELVETELTHEEIPDYVWDFITAWAEGTPLDFSGHEVPEAVQRHIERSLATAAGAKGFTVGAPIQEICKRFLNITHGTNWHYMAPEQWSPEVRWIYWLAKGNRDEAILCLDEVERIKDEAVKEREAEPESRGYSLGPGSEH